VFRYINKPWNEAEIKSSVEEAYRYYKQSVELESKVTELTSAYKELDNFAYSVSHDLKGPLMSIMGAMNIVNNTTDKNDETVLLMLDLIEKASAQLNEFIENMHVYYKNKRGQLLIDNIDLEEIKREIEVLHGLKCLQEHISLNISIQGNRGYFRTDATKVKVIVNNLVSNALKYQRPEETDKQVNIEFSVNGEELVIMVSDNGMGIEDQFVRNIFDLFFRATTEASGSGFGLYNVKEIVTLLGGTINVESKLNFGSTFTVKLPSK
jgi:two-component system, sensor histidine kinase and response regulator